MIQQGAAIKQCHTHSTEINAFHKNNNQPKPTREHSNGAYLHHS